jgi:hypothetical protein
MEASAADRATPSAEKIYSNQWHEIAARLNPSSAFLGKFWEIGYHIAENGDPRLYSYPLTTSRFSISSPVPGSCGRSVIRVAAGLWSPSALALSERSRGTDGAEPCCLPSLFGKSSSSTSTGAGCHTWCKRMGFVRVVDGDK